MPLLLGVPSGARLLGSLLSFHVDGFKHLASSSQLSVGNLKAKRAILIRLGTRVHVYMGKPPAGRVF